MKKNITLNTHQSHDFIKTPSNDEKLKVIQNLYQESAYDCDSAKKLDLMQQYVTCMPNALRTITNYSFLSRE